MTVQQHPPGKRGYSLRLSRLALAFVALAAIMGWGASFVGLHAYGMDQMVGFDYLSAWLIPATFDGAAFGATLITYRASIHGRSAVRGRLLMWTFTGISAWINWIHQITPEARIVASGLPVAAVAVFDVVLAELRADYEERHGKRRLRVRPGLLLLRWLVDRRGTSEAFRKQVTDIPVSEIAGLGGVLSPASEDSRTDLVLEAGAEPPRAITAAAATRVQLPPAPDEHIAPPENERASAVEPASSPVRSEDTATTSDPETSSYSPGAAVDHDDAPARQPVDVKRSVNGSGKYTSTEADELSMVQTVTMPVLPEGPLCPWPSQAAEDSASAPPAVDGSEAGVASESRSMHGIHEDDTAAVGAEATPEFEPSAAYATANR